jgi:hypothetical protein
MPSIASVPAGGPFGDQSRTHGASALTGIDDNNSAATGSASEAELAAGVARVYDATPSVLAVEPEVALRRRRLGWRGHAFAPGHRATAQTPMSPSHCSGSGMLSRHPVASHEGLMMKVRLPRAYTPTRCWADSRAA